MILKPGLGSLNVIENYTIRSGTHDFLLTFHSNHRPISHRFRDKRRFPSKIVNFSQPSCILRPRWRVTLGIGYRCLRLETRIMGLPGRENVWIYLQLSGYNTPTWQTDRRTDTGRQRRRRLSIASRGNNVPVTTIDLSATYDFILVLHSHHGHISYRIRDKRRFLSKIAFSQPPCTQCLCQRASYWNFVTAVALKTRVMPLPDCVQSLMTCFRLDTISECDCWTDRRTDRLAKAISRSACIACDER